MPLRLDLGPGFDLKSLPDGNFELTRNGVDTGRTIPANKFTRTGNSIEFTDSSGIRDLFPANKVSRIQDLVLANRGVTLKAIPFDTNKMLVDTDGKVFTRNSSGDLEELPGVKSYDPETGNMVIDSSVEADFNSRISRGMANPGQVIGPKDAQDALKPKDTETFADWEKRIGKYGSYALYLGVAIVGVTTIASFIEWLKGDTAAVNAEVFKIKEIKREGKITYTSQYKICAGDEVYGFGGFENVNKADMSSHTRYATGGGVGNLDDSSQTFEPINAGETVKPPDGKELTFRVETNNLRRLSCTLANIARDVAAGAASVTKEVTKGFFEGLGIDFAWVIGGFIALVVLAIVATMFSKK
jgi:hypothetical protein